LDEAEGMLVEKSAAIDAERDALEKRSRAEDARWEKQKQKLEGALRRARETCGVTVATAWRCGARKIFRHPLETKIRFFYFSVAIARWLLGASWARET
jgi:hypothetical protein